MARKIKIEQNKIIVPNDPVIPYIEGDGIGIDIWPAAQNVFDSAVNKAYGDKRKIEWKELFAGEKANKNRNSSRANHRNSGRLGTDAIGFYLSSIGRVPLLTPAEEIELAHHVQTMKKLLESPLEEQTPRQRHQIRMGKRARDRMMAANLRLVVSVAKKYQNQGLSLSDLIKHGRLIMRSLGRIILRVV